MMIMSVLSKTIFFADLHTVNLNQKPALVLSSAQTYTFLNGRRVCSIASLHGDVSGRLVVGQVAVVGAGRGRGGGGGSATCVSVYHLLHVTEHQ